MSPKQKPTISELRVGIFVIVSVLLLAIAIFAIGSSVGLLEEQFLAVTYLNNVAGLKPGDIVLMNGVEVGNVEGIRMTQSDELPITVRNESLRQRVNDLTAALEELQQQLTQVLEDQVEARLAYQEALRQYGESSPEAEGARVRLDDLVEKEEDIQDDLQDLQADIDDARNDFQNIEVLMRVNTQYRDWIRADSSISLGSVGLLGDKYIEISLGRTDQPALVDEREVEGFIFDSTREVVIISGAQQASFEELITGANDILANLQTVSGKIEEIMESFEEGRGSIGRFFNDPSFYNNLNDTMENANETVQKINAMVEDIVRGPGTVPRLIQERELYDNLTAVTDRLDSVVESIESGQGSAGKFIHDPSLYRNADGSLANLEDITRRINQGEGTLGRLATDEELYVNLNQSVERLADLLEAIRNGEGTLGRLANDEQLYANVNELSSELVKFMFDFRENPKKFLTIKFELF